MLRSLDRSFFWDALLCTILHVLLFNSKANSLGGRCGRRKKKGLDLLIEVNYGRVVRQQCLLNLRQPLRI